MCKYIFGLVFYYLHLLFWYFEKMIKLNLMRIKLNLIRIKLNLIRIKLSWKPCIYTFVWLINHIMTRVWLGVIDKVLLPPGKHVDFPIDGFSLFFNDDVINIIVKFTNLHGHLANEKWKDTVQIEIRVYIYFFYTLVYVNKICMIMMTPGIHYLVI